MPASSAQERFTYRRTPEGLFQCPHCDYTKKNQSSVNMHINAKHSGPLKHKCKHCTYEAATQQMLKNHLAAKHPNQASLTMNLLECPDPSCGYECKTKDQLRSHYLRKHMPEWIQKFEGTTNNGLLQCTHCSKEFNHKPSFVYHLPNCIPAEVLANEEVEKGLCL